LQILAFFPSNEVPSGRASSMPNERVQRTSMSASSAKASLEATTTSFTSTSVQEASIHSTSCITIDFYVQACIIAPTTSDRFNLQCVQPSSMQRYPRPRPNSYTRPFLPPLCKYTVSAQCQDQQTERKVVFSLSIRPRPADIKQLFNQTTARKWERNLMREKRESRLVRCHREQCPKSCRASSRGWC
jgi:hypothetical protein